MPYRPRIWHIGSDDVDLRIPLLRKIRDAGFDVAGVGRSCAEPFAAAGIPYHEYSLEPGLAPLADMRARRELIDLFRAESPDIVHAFTTKPSLIVPDAARACPGVHCVRTITGMGRLFSQSGTSARVMRAVYRAAHRRVADSCSMTIFQNSDDQGAFVQDRLLGDGQYALVPGSGVDASEVRASIPDASKIADLRRFVGVEDDGVLVLMVARLVAAKGVREFIAAAENVTADRKAKFVIVGPPDTVARSGRDLLREVEESPHVTFLGRREDVPALLAAADMFVLPTWYREGLPRVLLEAAVLSVPLVTTPVPGCREIVTNEVTGLTAPALNATMLARAIRRLIDDPALGRRLAAAAEERVLREFSLTRVARDTIGIYRDLLARTGVLNGADDSAVTPELAPRPDVELGPPVLRQPQRSPT